MGLIESILGKIRHLIKDPVGRRLINTVGNTAGHTQFIIAVHKVLAFLRHHIRFFLRHSSPHKVASSQIITGQFHNNLHDLFLIDNTAIGRFQNLFQLRTLIRDGRRFVLSLDITRNKIHWPWTIKRNTCNDILEIMGFQFLHEALHSRTFKLKNTVGFSCSDHIKNSLVIVINLMHVHMMPTVCIDQLHCILNNSQCTQPQKVHFQQSQLFQRGHGVLCRDHIVCASRQRYKLIDSLRADNNTCSMHGCMPRQTFQSSCHINQIVDTVIPVIELFQLRIHLQCLIDGNSKLIRNHLGHTITDGIRQIQDAPHITDHPPRCHCTKCNNLHHALFAIFSDNIINDFLSSFKTEIHVDIGHRHTVRIQESLKE